MATKTAPTLADIEAARGRILGHARATPVYSSNTLSRRAGRRVWLKAENLQRTGSFKVRGAVNKLSLLGDAERAAGVIAASAGNHGQAVAWAARELGINATVFMPQDAPMAKVEATRNYGAQTVLAGAGFDEALAAALESASETGATFVHAFEDEAMIAGQGTIGLELADELSDVETFVVPIGGGGLASGIAIALRALRPGVRIVGVQAGKTGRGTIADGIARQAPGRADDVDPRRPARRPRPRRGRADRRGDHAAARAGEARRRRRGRRVDRRAARQRRRRPARSACSSRAATSTRRCSSR